ncbi:hypothetical protein PHLCEN_2v6748 [Hermanssonia centrifuga]|uniref:Uncharacterized protein n=1 Tax=Hermanssonia centrifuga TaxID=98765 RepID=A0A2R6NYH5_9APHY|nr:hypothetical protein PHLCEN_2v6748 [Hermanssonia centrifuga]
MALTDLFDGAMIVLAMYTLLFFHPGRFLFSEPALEEMIKLESNTGSSTRQSLIKSL